MKIYKIAASAARSTLLDNFLATASGTPSLPDLYPALAMLADGGRNPSAIATTYATPSTNLPHSKNIAEFQNIMAGMAPTEPMMKVLYPLRGIIMEYVNLVGTPIPAPAPTLASKRAAVAKAFISIAGGSRAATRREQYPIMKTLLAKFKKEIESAANALTPPNTAIVTAVQQGALTDYTKMAPIAQGGKPMPNMYTLAHELIDNIMSQSASKSMQLINQQYEIVKEKFARILPRGGINADQEKQLQLDRQKEQMERVKNPKSVAPGAATPPMSIEEKVKSSVDPTGLTNPFFLLSIFIFFTEYIKEIGKLK